MSYQIYQNDGRPINTDFWAHLETTKLCLREIGLASSSISTPSSGFPFYKHRVTATHMQGVVTLKFSNHAVKTLSICIWDFRSSECLLLCIHVFFKIQFRCVSPAKAFSDLSRQSAPLSLSQPISILCACVIKPSLQCDYLLTFLSPFPEGQPWGKFVRDTFLL